MRPFLHFRGLPLLVSTACSVMALHGVGMAANVGPDQRLNLTVSPAIPSHCEMMNSVENSSISEVPARIQVMKAAGKMRIRCMSNDGMYRGAVEVSSKFDPAGGIVSIPWTVFAVATNIASDFDEDMAKTVSSEVKYPEHINVPMTIMTKYAPIPDAEPVDQAETIANQPQPDITVPPATQTHAKKRRSNVHHYTTVDSHS